MLCCVGLIGGFVVGQSLGGPWTVIAPAAGFGIGLVADLKFMKGHHHKGDRHDTEFRAGKDPDPVRAVEAHESRAEHQIEAPRLGDKPLRSMIMKGRKTA